jgi:hypothetical protein
MELKVVNHQNIPVGIGPEGEPFLLKASESNRLVEACGNAGVDLLALYPENLPEGFLTLAAGWLAKCCINYEFIVYG